MPGPIPLLCKTPRVCVCVCVCVLADYVVALVYTGGQQCSVLLINVIEGSI